MTLQQLMNETGDFVRVADAAKILGADPQSIREQARRDKAKLGFPVIVIGCRTKIPRLPFIAYIMGATEGVTECSER